MRASRLRFACARRGCEICSADLRPYGASASSLPLRSDSSSHLGSRGRSARRTAVGASARVKAPHGSRAAVRGTRRVQGGVHHPSTAQRVSRSLVSFLRFSFPRPLAPSLPRALPCFLTPRSHARYALLSVSAMHPGDRSDITQQPTRYASITLRVVFWAELSSCHTALPRLRTAVPPTVVHYFVSAGSQRRTSPFDTRCVRSAEKSSLSSTAAEHGANERSATRPRQPGRPCVCVSCLCPEPGSSACGCTRAACGRQWLSARAHPRRRAGRWLSRPCDQPNRWTHSPRSGRDRGSIRGVCSGLWRGAAADGAVQLHSGMQLPSALLERLEMLPSRSLHAGQYVPRAPPRAPPTHPARGRRH